MDYPTFSSYLSIKRFGSPCRIQHNYQNARNTLYVESPSPSINSAHFSVCVSSIGHNRSEQFKTVCATIHFILYIYFSMYFITLISGYSHITSHNSNLNIWFIVCGIHIKEKNEDKKQYFLISGHLHISTDVSKTNSEILPNFSTVTFAENSFSGDYSMALLFWKAQIVKSYCS